MLTILTIVLVGLSAAQLPAVDNSKYSMIVQNGQVIRMNTREGTFERCDAELKCVEVAQDK
jgi:peroxiredoxin